MGLALKLLAVPRPHNVYAAVPACKDTASWVYVVGGRIMGTPVPPDRQPTFGDATVSAQRYTVGTGVTLTFAVEVGTAGAIRPQEGTTTDTVNGQPVMVTQAPGTMMGIALTVTQPAALDRAVTITVRSPGPVRVRVGRDADGGGPDSSAGADWRGGRLSAGDGRVAYGGGRWCWCVTLGSSGNR